MVVDAGTGSEVNFDAAKSSCYEDEAKRSTNRNK